MFIVFYLVNNNDNFRQIVDAAHLKPLEKKDAIRPNDMKTVWNPFCQRKESYRN